MDNNIKLRFDLIPQECLLLVAMVITGGALKYAPDDWKKIVNNPVEIENFKTKVLRHYNNRFIKKEIFNTKDFNVLELAHLVVNAIFLLYNDIHTCNISLQEMEKLFNQKIKNL